MSEVVDVRITDKDEALEVAYAHKPFIDRAAAAREVGNIGLASQFSRTGTEVAREVEAIVSLEERTRIRQERDRAFSELCKETDLDVLTQTDFKIANPDEGPAAWQRLHFNISDDENFPVEFVEYYPGNFVLVGDAAAASRLAPDPELAAILYESAWALHPEALEPPSKLLQ